MGGAGLRPCVLGRPSDGLQPLRYFLSATIPENKNVGTPSFRPPVRERVGALSPSTYNRFTTNMKFTRALLAWYDANRRALPWRQTRDPYRIWVSEIMLQQTRVATVTLRYQQFLRRFPTIQKLAAAGESSVLAEWSGLGYYRRARNLHATAKIIAKQKKFPRTAEALRALPGIGRYTAAAIASIAFNQPVAVVDGNVERVLRRVLGEYKSDVIPSRKAARNPLSASSAPTPAPQKPTQPNLWTTAQSFLDA